MMTKDFAGLTAASVAVALLSAAPALAVTVTNQSDKTHEVVVDHGVDEPKTEIEAGKSMKLDCPNGCELRLTTSGYGLSAVTGDEAVIGKDGLLAYQSQAVKSDKTGGGGKTMVD